MLGKIEGRRIREQQRMRWLDGIPTQSMHMSLSQLWELVLNRESWHASVHGNWTESDHERVFLYKDAISFRIWIWDEKNIWLRLSSDDEFLKSDFLKLMSWILWVLRANGGIQFLKTVNAVPGFTLKILFIMHTLFLECLIDHLTWMLSTSCLNLSSFKKERSSMRHWNKPSDKTNTHISNGASPVTQW